MHPPPLAVKTPPPIVQCLQSLLLQLDWKLADATPRRLSHDSGFLLGLRQALGWDNNQRDPSPHDLHPSLANLDHVRRLINTVRKINFPYGTGFKGKINLHIFVNI